MKECDISTPFFDSKTNKCITCPSNTSLFDIRKSICISCPANSNYDSKAKICISKQVSPTIERMMMNSRWFMTHLVELKGVNMIQEYKIYFSRI